MTQDEIIEMAQECNLIGMRPHLDGIYTEALETFAKLVAAKEREACAKMVEDYMKETAIMEARGCLVSVAYDIRARGEA
jgi:hypothetical protein